MLTSEQRKAIEWAIGMASQHNIHNSPLRELLAASAAPAEGRGTFDERANPDPAAYLVRGVDSCNEEYASVWINRANAEEAAKMIYRASVTPLVEPATALATAPTMSEAVRDVLAERRRVIEQEGFTPEHDDEHDPGDLAAAACAYALAAADKLNPHSQGDGNYGPDKPPVMWPENWCSTWWKPSTPRRDLVKATQLIIAEIERLDRAGIDPKQQ